MSRRDSKEFIEQYLAALSGKPKPRAVVKQFVDDKELEDQIATLEAAFPKYELIADDIVAKDDKIALRATLHGVQLGEFHGVPAGGKSVAVNLMLIYRIADDKIVEYWMIADDLSLLRQLGAVAAPG